MQLDWPYACIPAEFAVRLYRCVGWYQVCKVLHHKGMTT